MLAGACCEGLHRCVVLPEDPVLGDDGVPTPDDGSGPGRGALPSRRSAQAEPCFSAMAASSSWYPAASLAPVVNLLVAAEISFSQATGVAAPWARDGEIASSA